MCVEREELDVVPGELADARHIVVRDERARAHGRGAAYVLSLATLWRLASRWYEGRLETPYERRDTAAAVDSFASVGLEGASRGLPEMGESSP